MTVRSDLEKATGLKSKKGEDLAAFKLRLIEAVNGLSDAEYKEIPRSARKWADDAIVAYNDSEPKKLSALPEFPEDLATDEAEDDLEEGVEEGKGADETDDEAETVEEDETVSDVEQTEDDEVTHTDVSESTGRKTRAKAKVAAKATRAKKATSAKAKKSDDGGGGKGLDFVRKLLSKNINMTAEELREKVKAAGYEVSDSTLSTGASGFRAAVRALQNAGKLKTTLLED
jgi:hypothetical protein